MDDEMNRASDLETLQRRSAGKSEGVLVHTAIYLHQGQSLNVAMCQKTENWKGDIQIIFQEKYS